jgi:hypothetical protein
MLVYFLILFAAVLRVMPHPANFAAVAATGLFAGVYLNKKQAILLPIATMLLSDVVLGFDSWQSRLVVYGSLALAGLIGMWVKNHKNIFSVASGSLLGSTLFYLLTNLVWLYPAAMYPHTLSGQLLSYVNALPFFRNTLLGDLFYTAVFFGIYEAVKYYAVHHSRPSSDPVLAGKN